MEMAPYCGYYTDKQESGSGIELGRTALILGALVPNVIRWRRVQEVRLLEHPPIRREDKPLSL